MFVRHPRLALAGVITALCCAFLARTPAAIDAHQGKSMGPRCGETARRGRVFAALLAAVATLVAACDGSSNAGSPA